MDLTFENSMTIYYKKRNGDIVSILSGIQDMNMFNDDKEDYSLIWDYNVFEFDQYVFDNHNNFNIIDRQIKLKNDTILDKYI